MRKDVVKSSSLKVFKFEKYNYVLWFPHFPHKNPLLKKENELCNLLAYKGLTTNLQRLVFFVLAQTALEEIGIFIVYNRIDSFQ